MRKPLFLIILLVIAWTMVPLVGANAASDTQSKIAQIKQERQKLAKIKKRLERQLGAVGRELRSLDADLIEARKASREAHAKVLATDRKLVELKRKSKQLQEQIKQLKQAMLNQAAAAWQRSSRSSPWMGVLTGVAVSDIPHRRYLLNEVMRSQEQDRQVYAEAVAELAKVEVELTEQRARLEQFRQEKKQAALALAARVKEKRKMIDHVRRDMRAKKRKEERLAREEKALLQLLDDMSEDLLAIDRQQAEQLSVRKRRGKLKWPVRGRIVASFRSRPKPRMPRLQGVQMRPGRNVKEVKAMAAGQVRYADWFGGFGLMTIVDYGEGVLGVYAHNDVLYKQLGDWVEEGEIIADAGSTGWVNDVRLYFEIRDRGKAVNPKRWCRR